ILYFYQLLEISKSRIASIGIFYSLDSCFINGAQYINTYLFAGIEIKRQYTLLQYAICDLFARLHFLFQIFTLMTNFLINPSPIIGACTSSGKKIANCPPVNWKNISGASLQNRQAF